MLYRISIVEPEVRWFLGKSDRAALYGVKSYGPPTPPLQICPSGMNPSVRPPPSERSTANQLYSGVVPDWAIASAQAGLYAMICPFSRKPSCQHRKVRLPGNMVTPC